MEPITINSTDILNINGEFFTGEDLIEIIQSYKRNNYSYLQNQDILSQVMLHSNVEDVNSLLRSSKITSKRDNNFWMNKFMHDFPNVKARTQQWLQEYQHIYTEYVRASNFMKVLFLIKADIEEGINTCCYFDSLYLSLPDREIYADELPILPDKLKCILEMTQDAIVMLTLDMGIFYIHLNYGDKSKKYKIAEKELAMMLAALFYTHPDIIIWDAEEHPYLYNPLEDEPTEPTKEWQCIYEYWKKILNK